jgi:hypothetical protein
VSAEHVAQPQEKHLSNIRSHALDAFFRGVFWCGGTLLAAACGGPIEADSDVTSAVESALTKAETEDNGTMSAADRQSAAVEWESGQIYTITGTVGTPTDVDYFYVRRIPSKLKIQLKVPAGLDYDAQIVDRAGRVFAQNHQGPGVSESLSFSYNEANPPQYPLYVRVFGVGGASSATAQYQIIPGT